MHIFCYGLPNPVQTRTPDGKVAKSATSNNGLKFFLKYHCIITIRILTFQNICLSTMCPVVHALIQNILYLLQREFKPIVLAKLHLKQPAHSSLRLFPTRKIHIWNVAFIPIVWWTELKWKRKKRTPSMSSAALSELVTKTGLYRS